VILALDDHSPRQVGPYRLLGRLGAGGMGQVFLGEDAAGRRAAVKVVHPGLAHDPRFRARFAREVAAGRRVRGRWTAELLDADADATPPWLATEYIAGPTLDQVVHDLGPVPADAMTQLALGLARALVAIHGAGLLHRDIKPSNVLLTGDGPRLIDFGIAHAVDGTRLTSTGGIVGTPAFMSPEQVGAGALGPASDVFSLGGVLVFAATGTGPFGTATPVVLLRRVLTAAPDLGALDEPLRGIAGACLRRDPADRPTPAQLVEQLAEAAERRSGWLPSSVTTVATAPPGTTGGKAPRRVRRRVLLGAAAVVGVGAAAGLFTWWRAPTPAVRWSFAAGGVVTGLAVSGGTVFVGAENNVVSALDATTGQSRWSYQGVELSRFLAAGPVVVAGGSVIDARTGTALGQLDGVSYNSAGKPDVIVDFAFDPKAGGNRLRAIDPVSRALRWQSPPLANCRGDAVLLSDDVVLLVDCGGVDVAFDLVTGAQLWTSAVGSGYSSYSAATAATFYLARYDARPPTSVSAGSLGRTTVNVVDARTGSVRWSAEHDGHADGVAVIAGQLYVREGGRLSAYDDTGARRWTWKAPAEAVLQRITGSADHLVAAGGFYGPYGADRDGTWVASVDPARGSTNWQISLPERPSHDPDDALLAVAGDTVLAGSGPTVYAIGADGA
jgi:outer membrane protein assembly factor BamB